MKISELNLETDQIDEALSPVQKMRMANVVGKEDQEELKIINKTIMALTARKQATKDVNMIDQIDRQLRTQLQKKHEIESHVGESVQEGQIDELSSAQATRLANLRGNKQETPTTKIPFAKKTTPHGGAASRVAEANEGTDTIQMDVALFIRCLEWAKEDAADDVALHKFTEKVVAKSGVLTMADYEDLIPQSEMKESSDQFEPSKDEINNDNDPATSRGHKIDIAARNKQKATQNKLKSTKQGTISEAPKKTKYDKNKVYSDDAAGIAEFMTAELDPRYVKELGFPKDCKIHADPSVQGVWAVDSYRNGARVIIYLMGYPDAWDVTRASNDFETGSLPFKSMQRAVESGTVNRKQLEFWVKCDNLSTKQFNDLVRYLDESVDVTSHNPKSQGGTRKELLAKYAKSKSSADATAARKAGATQEELRSAKLQEDASAGATGSASVAAGPAQNLLATNKDSKKQKVIKRSAIGQGVYEADESNEKDKIVPSLGVSIHDPEYKKREAKRKAQKKLSGPSTVRLGDNGEEEMYEADEQQSTAILAKKAWEEVMPNSTAYIKTVMGSDFLVFCLSKDKTEVANGILENDPLSYRARIRGGNFEELNGSLFVKPTQPHLAYGSEKFRKKTIKDPSYESLVKRFTQVRQWIMSHADKLKDPKFNISDK